MALVKTFDAWDLKKEFERFDRDYFSMTACEELINLFDECGNVEIDIIGICCDFTEAYTDDIVKDYLISLESRGFDYGAYVAGEYDTDDILEFLNYYTYAVETENDMILYQCF